MLGIFIAIYLKSMDSYNVYISLEEKRHLKVRLITNKVEISNLKNRKEELRKEFKCQYKCN